jgi:hypothetical protein
MPCHMVFEGQLIEDKLQEETVQTGDIIQYISNNQEGWAVYRVIERDGKKALEEIANYYSVQLD